MPDRENEAHREPDGTERQDATRALYVEDYDAIRTNGATTAGDSTLGPHDGEPAPLPPLGVIGRYRLLSLLGEGGMGAVYEAQQDHPQRTVALKVIRPGYATAETLRRFENETQALGRLQHPGIAQIYEAGMAETPYGIQPWFAMELVRGQTLNAYCDRLHLTARQRLELVARICDAVQHAHQRGLIHRDLKPGNIMVDQDGQPRILDFGVARATDLDAQATRQTNVGELIGTLAYMSPEQVLGDSDEVDTRSDVYSLGIILYELLASKSPYVIGRQVVEAIRVIREEEPTALSSVNRTFRGDVETIVAKALEKDKARRYGSAAELAADIRHYLHDEPIVARPASASYQLQKFARRNKALVIGVAAVFLALAVGIVASTWEAVRARRAETRAQSETASAQAVNDFLQNDLLGQASSFNQASVAAEPNTKADPDIKVRTALDRAAARISGKFAHQPEVEASIRSTIGQSYKDLGLYTEARSQVERALELQRQIDGPENQKTLATMSRLAAIEEAQGKPGEAEELQNRTLQIQRRVLGNDHPDTLHSISNLGMDYESEGKFKQAEIIDSQALDLARRVLGPENSETLQSMNNLANVYQAEGKYSQEEPLRDQTLAVQRRVLGPEHPGTLMTMGNLSSTYENEGKYPQAKTLAMQVVDIARRVLGPEHPTTLVAMQKLASIDAHLGKYAEAEALDSSVLEVQKRVLGPDHPQTLFSLNSLGMRYEAEGKFPEAEVLLTQALESFRRVRGPEHLNTLACATNLAVAYGGEGKVAQSAALYREILAIQRRTLGPENPQTLFTVFNLGYTDYLSGKYAEGIALNRQSVDHVSRALGPEHPDTANAIEGLACNYSMAGQYAEAGKQFEKALAIQLRVLGADNPLTIGTYSDRAAMYQREGQYNRAEADAKVAYEGQRRVQGPAAQDTINAAADLALAYVSEGKFALAEPLARAALEGNRKTQPDTWQRYRAESLLGASLTGQQKHAEALPLLREGYQGMVARKEKISVPDQYHLARAHAWLAHSAAH